VGFCLELGLRFKGSSRVGRGAYVKLWVRFEV
jgi:hypothetical protein